jgi:hypothetical protein
MGSLPRRLTGDDQGSGNGGQTGAGECVGRARPGCPSRAQPARGGLTSRAFPLAVATSRAPGRRSDGHRHRGAIWRGAAGGRALPRRAGRGRVRDLARWPPLGADLAAWHQPGRAARRAARRDRGTAARRVPSPAAELAIQAGDAVALVWELLPGTPITHLTSALLHEALAPQQPAGGPARQTPRHPRHRSLPHQRRARLLPAPATARAQHPHPANGPLDHQCRGQPPPLPQRR